MFMWAVSADGTAALTVEWEGAATAAWNEDGFDQTADVTDRSVSVTLVTGRLLSGFYCNDILQPGQGPDREISAASGTARLVVRPDAQGLSPSATADLNLSDVDFEVIAGDEPEIWHLELLEWANVRVGWLAG